jgi:hypothetical protein
MRGIERALGVLAGVSGPLYIALVSFSSNRAVSCTYSHCTASTGSFWQRHPAEIAVNVVLAAATGSALTWLVWSHSSSDSGGQLATMWIASVLFGAMTVFLAFTVYGSATFFFAVFGLLAAIVGSVRQESWLGSSREGGGRLRTGPRA